MEVGYPGSCQAPGLCNGSGACRTYAKLGVECDVDTCTDSTLKSYECNGTGLCKEKSVSCYPFKCDAGGTACRIDCSDDAHCVTGSSCEDGTCVGQLELGQACTRGAQCKSTYCANVGEGWLDGQDPILDPVTNEPIVNHDDYPGVCCDEDCRGLCRGCKKSIKGGGSDGICDPVADHSDPKDDCPLDTTNSCGQNGNCNGAGGCRRTPNGTSCGQTSCQGNSVLGQTCQEGQCQTNPSGTDCEPYVCRDVNGAFQCTNPCADDNDCQDGYYCTEMACKKKLANGQACETSGICNSGYCVDGVCCDASCNGQCEACGEPGSEGVCIAVEGQPRGNRTECDFAGEECGGACDGVNAASCDYAPTGTECGTPSCTNSVADASECDGSGSCRPKDPERCLPFACGDDDRCLITCAIDEDCSSGFRCDVAAQSCVPANVAAECSEDGLDSVGQNGIKTPCKPFLCVASSGTCAVSCAFTQDCAPGFVCESSTKTCLPAPEGGVGEEEGCACRAAGAPTRSSNHYLALVALGLAVAGLRRRRRPQLAE
jgi:MYXO-CTERM domain-containing protein